MATDASSSRTGHSGPHLSRARGRPQWRRALALLPGLWLAAPAAEAVTLRQYFFELSDRDRGVYLTGLLDLLRADPERESEFLRCVHDQGVPRMHALLTDMVRQEPRILAFEVAPWFFYAAGKVCPRGSRPPARPAEESLPDAALPELGPEPPPVAGDAAAGPRAALRPDLLLAGAAGAALGAAAAMGIAALRRRRRGSAPGAEEGA